MGDFKKAARVWNRLRLASTNYMVNNVRKGVTPDKFKHLNPLGAEEAKGKYKELYNSYKAKEAAEDAAHKFQFGEEAQSLGISFRRAGVNEARKIRSLIVREVRNLLDPS